MSKHSESQRSMRDVQYWLKTLVCAHMIHEENLK